MAESVVGIERLEVVKHGATSEIARAKAAGAAVLDVTSKGPEPWVRFSPFYPHRYIPIPLSTGYFTASVEGAWQALKVFEKEGIDRGKLQVVNMKNLKRSASERRGKILGHQAGIAGQELLRYLEARKQIYLPLYRWVLDRKLQPELAKLRALMETQPVVLLDYTTNGDVNKLTVPLSHAALIKAYVEGAWPE